MDIMSTTGFGSQRQPDASGAARHRCRTRRTPDAPQVSPTGPGADDKPPRPRATRVAEGAILGGVCTGLARHLGWPVMVIRIGFVGLLLVQFLGAIAYGALWLLLPPEPEESAPGLEAASRSGMRTATKPPRRIDWGSLLALAALATGLLWLVQTSRLGGQRPPVLAGGLRLRRRGAGVAAGRHEPAAEVARRGWWARLVGAVRGPRWLALGAAGGRRTRPRRCRVRDGGGAAEPDPGAARGDGHDRAGAGRSGGRAGALALPLPDRPQRRRGPRRSGPMPAPTWLPTCTTRCCRRWP